MPVQPRKLEKLKKRLQTVLNQRNLQTHRAVVEQLSQELMIDPTDCAAGLLFISQPHLFQCPKENESVKTLTSHFKPATRRNVRYRLDVGTQHQVTAEDLIEVLIEESGVDRKRIGRIEMHETYSLVDLPDGMPADIFQLLSEAAVGDRRLNIKRVKQNRRKYRDPKLAGNRRPEDVG
ncbi:DbpA RNA binding domain-containing protein [Methylomonas sp. MgM2]